MLNGLYPNAIGNRPSGKWRTAWKHRVVRERVWEWGKEGT